MIAACTIWGLSPLFYKLLAAVPPGEVLAHRTIWSFVFFAVILIVQGRFIALFQSIASARSFCIIFFASLMIATNWFLFIYSVQVGRVLEASLGYYIFPLVAVFLGTVVFRERLVLVQWGAVVLAAAAVVVLTIGLAVPPWIALTLAITFGLYGVVKKRLSIGPVAAEVLILLPIAALWLYLMHSGLATEGRPGAVWGLDVTTTALLIATGPMTGGPLMLFSYASKRVDMASLGLIQYINPTLQFGCAVLIFLEPFTIWHAIAFPLIWLALAVYSVAVLRRMRAVKL